MNTIFINKADEDWIVDRFRDEWESYNPAYLNNDINKSDIIWIIAPWNTKNIDLQLLNDKKVVCTIHHIDIEKFKGKEKKDFYKIDQFVDHYHAISKKTEEVLKQFTKKPISFIPFWINQNVFFNIENKKELKKKYEISSDSYLVGSFQRDTEKKGFKKPKLSKGPDNFIQIAKHLYEINPQTNIVLAGKRREYIISKLKKEKIPFNYFEMVNFKELNELYNILDLYIVASRVEGGPAAILECAASKTPIISTDVGLVSDVLHPNSIFNMENFKKARPNVYEAYKNSIKYHIPNGFEKFNNFFQSL